MSGDDDILARLERLERLVESILPGAQMEFPGFSEEKPATKALVLPKLIMGEWDTAHEYIRKTPYARIRSAAEARDAKALGNQVEDAERRMALMYVALTDPTFEARNGTFQDFVSGLPRWTRELEKAEGAPAVLTRAQTGRDKLKAAVRMRIMERNERRLGEG